MAISEPDPIHIIQNSRYVKQDGWRLDDISLSSSGIIAVSGINSRTYQSYVCLYFSTDDNSGSTANPKLLYHTQFRSKGYWPSWWPRYISFIKPNSTEIVTCRHDEIQVIDYNRDVVLRVHKVYGDTTCIFVCESQIFIGLFESDIVNIYDNDLNRIKSIRLKGIRHDWPKDIAAAADRLYVCTALNGRAIVYSQDGASILTEYTAWQDNSKARRVAVNKQLGLIAVLWIQRATDRRQIIFYLLFENKPFLTVDVVSRVSRIRISDQGRIVTGNEDTGEVKMYNLVSLFPYSRLKESLVPRLERDDCEKLADFFAMGGEELKGILNSDRPASALLLALEEKGLIQPSNVDRLEEAFLGRKMSPLSYRPVNLYQKLRDQITPYDRFLATLSAHLISSVPADLCDYFDVPDEQKDSIISSQNPGLSLLLVLDEMGVIRPLGVGCLEEPFKKFRFVQALAKIDEYKEILKEGNRLLPQTTPHSLKDKRAMFVKILQKKIKSWYETMTPVPWKKSCQWKSTDLFVGTGLILTDSKEKQNVHNIDEQCKLTYKEIFTHEKLKCEIRIILEGDPGAGKTMLSSQLAYDWSKGNIDGVDILIFLPLKIVEDKTIVQAIKEFYIPTNTPLSEKDIKSILASDTERICLLLDGLEENITGARMGRKESSEVIKIMKKEKFSNCKVVITCRSDVAHAYDLPDCPMLKLGRFGENQRNSYIEKLSPHNTEKQQKMKRIIQDNPFILDLCSVPLLFVLAVHNIESMSLSEEGQLNKVSPFMRRIITTLCSSSSVKHEVDGLRPNFFGREKMTLGELAFNGLCKGHQQLSWQKDFMENNIGNFKAWVDSGILVLEDGLVISEKEDQDIFERNKGKEKKENAKKNKEEENRTPNQEAKGEGKKEKTPEGDSSKKPKTEKKKKERGTDKFEIAPDNNMSMAEYSWPSASHDIPQLPVLPEDTVSTAMSASKTVHKLSKIDERHQSVSELETDPQVMTKTTVRRTARQVPLTVKFLHKVIQEWFAATFFCSMIRRCTSEDHFQSYVFNQLQHIRPRDLHFVLRFTSYLHPPSCHVIMKFLLRTCRKDGYVPPNIMNCVFLCFNEHNHICGPDMRNAVIDVCKEVITIQPEDSRLLQKAKSSLLEYASNDGINIEKLKLKDIIFAVDETSLTLNSGVQLGILHTVKMIEVSRWDQVLREEDYKTILKLISAGALLKKVCCIFPSEPPDILDEKTLENIASKDLKVEWHIGHLVQSLDQRTGKWMKNFRQPGTSSTQISEVSADQDRFGKGSVDYEFYKEKDINEKGGTLIIPEAEVRLEVGPGALSRDHTIQIKVSVDINMCPPSSQDLPRLTPLIICEPDGLEFIKPVKLTVPHCAVIQEPDHHKVTVKIGHKNRSTNEWAWREETVEYCLTRKTCSVFLRHFSGVNVNIDGTEEKMLRVIPYAKLTRHSKEVLLTLWFCNDLESHFQSVMRCGENTNLVPLDSYDTFKLRHVKGAKSVNVILKDASNDWFEEVIKDSIGVNSLSGENQLYRDFRLPTVSDLDNSTYLYLDLRVTQHLEKKESETPFALRKRISDLRKPFSLRRLYSPYENEESIPSPQENPTDRCFAVPYIDPMRDHEDDVILTLWLCPFESQRKKLQCLQKEQNLLLKHMVKGENSFALSQKETVTAITRFVNGRWRLTPELKEIETKRIKYGSRAKFQFIGKKKDKDEISFINLEVHTFQDENDRTPFIEEVEMSQLLYGNRNIEVPNTEDLSGLFNQASVVPSNLESAESSRCSLSYISSSSSEAKTSERSPLRTEVKTDEKELKFIFLFLKRKLAKKWKDVARYLDISEGDIGGFKIEYGDDNEECIYQMFLHWQQRKGHEATLQQVKAALRRVDRKDLSDKIDKGEHLE